MYFRKGLQVTDICIQSNAIVSSLVVLSFRQLRVTHIMQIADSEA